MTKRGRNASVRFLTGHDMKGFADHDWESLAKPNEVAAIYMGKKSARFVQGRLLMFGALHKRKSASLKMHPALTCEFWKRTSAIWSKHCGQTM